MISHVIGCYFYNEVRNAKNLVLFFHEKFKELGLNTKKIQFLVADEGDAVKSMPFLLRNIAGYSSSIKYHPCAAHRLQTALRRGFSEFLEKYRADNDNSAAPLSFEVITETNSYLGRISILLREFCTHFNNSSLFKLSVEKYAQDNHFTFNKFFKPTKTRWLSVIDFLRTAIDNKELLKAWASEMITSYNNHNKYSNDKRKPSSISFFNSDNFPYSDFVEDEFWKNVDYFFKFLTPFEIATNAFSTDSRPTLGSVAYVVGVMKYRMQKEVENVGNLSIIEFEALATSIKKFLDFKFKFSDSELISLFLSPESYEAKLESLENYVPFGEAEIVLKEYLRKNFSNEISITQTARSQQLSPLSELLEEVSSTTTTDATMNTYDEIDAMIENFKAIILLPNKRNNFWESKKNQFKQLYTIYRRFMCTPCSQTTSEREFSRLGLVHTANRGSLSSSTVNSLVVISCLMARIKESKTPRIRSQKEIDSDADRSTSLIEYNKK